MFRSEDLQWNYSHPQTSSGAVYRFQYNAILKAIHTGVGFGSGTETTVEHLKVGPLLIRGSLVAT